MPLFFAVISHHPILGGLGELVDFLGKWSWVHENVEEILPVGISQIIDELRQQVNSAREVMRCLDLYSRAGCVPDGDSLRRLERMLAGVRRLKMDVDVRRVAGQLSGNAHALSTNQLASFNCQETRRSFPVFSLHEQARALEERFKKKVDDVRSDPNSFCASIAHLVPFL